MRQREAMGEADTAFREASNARREAMFGADRLGTKVAGAASEVAVAVREDAAELVEARQALVNALGLVQVAWPDVVTVGDAVAQRRLLRALGAYRDVRARQERRAAASARTSAGVPPGGTTVSGPRTGWFGLPVWSIWLLVAGEVIVVAVLMWFVLG